MKLTTKQTNELERLKKETIPCSVCGYYEDIFAWHYDDCSKLIEMGLSEYKKEL
jgi:hypothetical protein